MNKLLSLALISVIYLAGCGPKPGGSPYEISSDKAPVQVKLARGGRSYTPPGNSPSVALYGVGGFRVDLQPKGDGVFASSPDNPVPLGEYSVTMMGTQGRAMLTQTVARNVKVVPGSNDFTFEVK